MTQPTAGEFLSDSEELAKRIRLYRDMGFTAERTVLQLCRVGFDHALIASHFPQVPPEVYTTASGSKRAQRSKPSGPAQLPLAALGDRRGPPSVPTIRKAVAAPRAPVEVPPIDEISFQYVPLIQCSFPHADPGEVTTFSRKNGWLELTLSTAKPEVGLPYGVPARLLTIYCASEAIRSRSPEIFLGHNVHDFLRRLEIPITRGERGSLRVYANQLMRLVSCAVSIDENITDGRGRAGLHIKQAHFAEEARLWWEDDGAGEGSSLVLSHTLFESILERSAPLSTNAIKQLRKSPMDLDVYAWLVHRLFTLGKPSTISWAQLSGQFGHSYSETRNFRQFFLASLKRVQAVYPEARVAPSANGLTLLPSKPHVPRTAVAVPR